MTTVRGLTNAVLSALLAPPCVACARVVDRPLDGAVCDSCWDAVDGPQRPVMPVSSVIRRGSAIGEYEGTLRDIIHALKYDGRRSVATRLSRLMAEHGSEVLAGADVLVPVPLHRRRHRERGFNQADDLARGLGLPIVHALQRVKRTQPQVDLPAAERHLNVRDAFAIAPVMMSGRPQGRPLQQGEPPHTRCGGRPLGQPYIIPGTIIVLVDDVTTTGATLDACARVLRQAGAREVRALTAARVATGPR